MSQPFPQIRATALLGGLSVPSAYPVTAVSSVALVDNPARIQFSIVYPSSSTGILYVTFGSVSSSTLFSYYLNPGDILVSEVGEWFGDVSVIASVAGPEDIYITELR